MAPADTRDPLLLFGSLENIQTASGVKNGADANYLDSRLLEVFKAYSADYKTKVDQGGFYEWAEKNKLTLIVTADATMNMAQGAIAYGTLAYGGNHSLPNLTKKTALDKKQETELDILRKNQEIDAIRDGSPIPIPRNATYQIDYVTGKITYKWKDGVISTKVTYNIISKGQSPNWSFNSGRVMVAQGQQDKHIPGTNNYNQELLKGRLRSILTSNPQQLLDDYAYTGKEILNTNKERVDFDKIIGQYYDEISGTYTDTTKGVIHYDSKGQAHIVPARP